MKKFVFVLVSALVLTGVVASSSVSNEFAWSEGADPMTAPKLKLADFSPGPGPMTVPNVDVVEFTRGGEPMTVISMNDKLVAYQEGADSIWS